jgi:hypothetical protein
VNLRYGAEYEAFRSEVRAFLAEHWTAEDKAAGRRPDENSVAASLGANNRTDERATAFRLKAIARGYSIATSRRATAAASSRPTRSGRSIIAEEFRRHDARSRS